MYQVKDGCPGCGNCLAVCPVDAITPNGLGVTITDKCIDCGVCVSACPIGLIYQTPKTQTTSVNNYVSEVPQEEDKEGGELDE